MYCTWHTIPKPLSVGTGFHYRISNRQWIIDSMDFGFSPVSDVYFHTQKTLIPTWLPLHPLPSRSHYGEAWGGGEWRGEFLERDGRASRWDQGEEEDRVASHHNKALV